MIPPASLPPIPPEFVSHFLIPLAQFDCFEISDNATDQLTHLKLLAFEANKEPSLQGIALFAMKSLSTSLDSFCSVLLNFIFSTPNPPPSSFLILSTLSTIIKERKNEIPKCVEFLKSHASNSVPGDQLNLSCILLCLSSFAENYNIHQIISALISLALQSGQLSQLCALFILTEVLKSSPHPEFFERIFPSLMASLKNPPFEHQIPETIALLLPLLKGYFQENPKSLELLLRITVDLIKDHADSLSASTVNRLFTILRFCTEDPLLILFSETYLHRLLPKLFPLLPTDPSIAEELLQIIYNIISNFPEIPPQFKSIFPYLPETQAKDNNELNNLLHLLNLFLYLSPSSFASNDISIFFSMAQNCLQINPSDVFDPGYSRAHGNVLISLIMDAFRKDLPVPHIQWAKQHFWSYFQVTFPDFKTPFSIAFDMVPAQIDSYQEQLFNIFLLGAHLFPSHFLDFTLNAEVLHFLGLFTDLICEFTTDFSSAFDRKILLLGLISIFRFILDYPINSNDSLYTEKFKIISSIFEKILIILKMFQFLDKFREEEKEVKKRNKVIESLEPLILKCEALSDILGCPCDLRESLTPKNENDQILAAMLDSSHQRKKLMFRIKSRLFQDDELESLKEIVAKMRANGNEFQYMRGLICQTAFEFSDELLNSTHLVQIGNRIDGVTKYRKIRTLKRRIK
jgi:hypothetical protein